MKPKVAVVGLFLLAAPAAQAGPWAVGKGHYYFKLSYQYLRSTTLYAPDGTRFDIPVFRKDDGASYLAYGLSDRLTFYSSVPFLRSSDLRDVPDELTRATGLGDVQAGLQLQLGRRGPWVLAVRGTVQLPTGDETRAEGLLPTGSGVWEGEVYLAVGRSLAGGKGFGFVEVGSQARGGGLRDGFLYGLQVGWNVTERLVLAANARGVEPYSRTPGARTAGSFVGVGDRVTYLVYGPTAIVRLNGGWGLQLDAEGATHARNLATGLVLRAGVTFQR